MFQYEAPVNKATDNAVRGQRPIDLNLELETSKGQSLFKSAEESKQMMREIKVARQVEGQAKPKRFRQYMMYRMLPINEKSFL